MNMSNSFLASIGKKSSKTFFAIFIFSFFHIRFKKIPSDHFGAGVETTKAALIQILLRPGALYSEININLKCCYMYVTIVKYCAGATVVLLTISWK